MGMAHRLRRVRRALRRTCRRTSRHDAVLALIPAAFVGFLLAGGLLGVPARTAVGAAAGVGALAMLDALFLNPPRGPAAAPGA